MSVPIGIANAVVAATASPTKDVYGDLPTENDRTGASPGQQGVFAQHPLATPKYAINRGARDAEYKDTLARIYVSLAGAGPNTKEAYLKSLEGVGDARVTALAEVLVGSKQAKGSTGFVDFFLGQVNESFQEAVQVDKVLGDGFVAFFFGQNPPIFQYAGTLLNSQQDDQRAGFALAYQHILRGTQLARRGALMRLRYDSVIVSGSVLGHSQILNAENELAVPFNFTLLVTEYVVLTNLRFNKMNAADFVKLALQQEVEKLGPITQASDARVRTGTVVHPTSEAAGEPTDVHDWTQGPLALFNATIDKAKTLGLSTLNILGTVTNSVTPQFTPSSNDEPIFNGAFSGE